MEFIYEEMRFLGYVMQVTNAVDADPSNPLSVAFQTVPVFITSISGAIS